MHLRLLLLLSVFALVLVPSRQAHVHAAPEAETPPHVVLKSGQVLAGKVLDSLTVQGTPMWKVHTDFGEILVPKSAVGKRDGGTPVAKDATFLARHVRVVRVVGDVQRRSGKDGPWEKVTFTDPYAKEPKLNAPNALVEPGDTVKTGPDGQIDLMLHKDVWVRINADSEVEIPNVRSRGSLTLLRGDVLNKVDGQPRGEVFRVETPSAVLGVRGTRFDCSARAAERLRVTEGIVLVEGGPEVRAGQEAHRTAGGAWEVVALSEAGRGEVEVKTHRFPVDRMALVPAGTYVFGGIVRGPPGGSTGLEGLWPTETPSIISSCDEFRLELEAFVMDTREFEVATLRTWQAATGSNNVALQQPSGEGAGAVLEAIAWTDAVRFARWMGRLLPTEAQWEAAARGPKGLTWPWGNQLEETHRRLAIYLFPRGAGWSPGHVRPPFAGEPSVDVSAFGVQGMCTDPPEWCRTPLVDEVFFPHALNKRHDDPSALDRQKVIRGCMGAARLRFNNADVNVGASLRGVVELR